MWIKLDIFIYPTLQKELGNYIVIFCDEIKNNIKIKYFTLLNSVYHFMYVRIFHICSFIYKAVFTLNVICSRTHKLPLSSLLNSYVNNQAFEICYSTLHLTLVYCMHPCKFGDTVLLFFQLVLFKSSWACGRTTNPK